MTPDEISNKYKKICELKKDIKNIQSERVVAERALVEQYKVNECNQSRNTLALNYQGQVNFIQNQINAIEDELGTK